MKEKKLNNCLIILLEISEFIVFCVVWMIVGPLLIDINQHISVNIFACKEPLLCWFIYGVAAYFGGRVIYLCISKITKVFKTIF